MAILMPNDFLNKFDLKSGYHHVEIFQPHWTYLGFSWGSQSHMDYYVFTVLPFGLPTACYVFTKLLRPLVKCRRGQGLRAVVYLDDGIVATAGLEAAMHASGTVQITLQQVGLVVNIEKSLWNPTQSLTWLGFSLDLSQGTVSVPDHKIEALRNTLAAIVDKDAIPAKQIASIVGKILSMSITLGPVARLMTRSLYALLNHRKSWFQRLTITAQARTELSFWSKSLAEWNLENIWKSPSAIRVVYSDASGSGFGGYTVEHSPQIVHTQWSEWEAQQSSTWRELKAVHMVLQALAPKLQNEQLRWLTDNQNVVRIVLHGSKKPLFQELALSVFQLCVVHHVTIEPEWIPREENELADYISKLRDYDDWMVHPVIFQQIDQLWEPHTVDRFANTHNAQLERFNS